MSVRKHALVHGLCYLMMKGYKILTHCAMRRSSCTHTSAHSSVHMPFAVGTRSIDPCTHTIAFTKAAVAHFTWHTKSCERPGRTNACVTMRISPFPITLLHALHVARLVGACPIVNVLARVLNPAVRRIARPRPDMEAARVKPS